MNQTPAAARRQRFAATSLLVLAPVTAVYAATTDSQTRLYVGAIAVLILGVTLDAAVRRGFLPKRGRLVGFGFICALGLWVASEGSYIDSGIGQAGSLAAFGSFLIGAFFVARRQQALNFPNWKFHDYAIVGVSALILVWAISNFDTGRDLDAERILSLSHVILAGPLFFTGVAILVRSLPLDGRPNRAAALFGAATLAVGAAEVVSLITAALGQEPDLFFVADSLLVFGALMFAAAVSDPRGGIWLTTPRPVMSDSTANIVHLSVLASSAILAILALQLADLSGSPHRVWSLVAGTVLGVSIAFRMILMSAISQTKARMEIHAAGTDRTTGLLGPDQFFDAVASAGSRGGMLTLLSLRQNGFSGIDSYGPEGRDEITVIIADRLRSAAALMPAGTITLGRLAPNQFGVFDTNVLPANLAEARAAMWSELPLQPIGLSSGVANIESYSGFARCADIADSTATALSRSASIALSAAIKRSEVGRPVRYTHNMQVQTDAVDGFISAINSGDVVTLFNGAFDVDGGLTGLDCQVRWHDNGRELTFTDFGTALLDTPAEVSADCKVTNDALKAIRKLNSEGDFATKVSITLGMGLVCDPALPAQLDTHIRNFGINPAQLVVHVRNDHQLKSNIQAVAHTIAQLKKRKINSCVDYVTRRNSDETYRLLLITGAVRVNGTRGLTTYTTFASGYDGLDAVHITARLLSEHSDLAEVAPSVSTVQGPILSSPRDIYFWTADEISRREQIVDALLRRNSPLGAASASGHASDKQVENELLDIAQSLGH